MNMRLEASDRVTGSNPEPANRLLCRDDDHCQSKVYLVKENIVYTRTTCASCKCKIPRDSLVLDIKRGERKIT